MVLPTQVLMPSMMWRRRWTVMRGPIGASVFGAWFRTSRGCRQCKAPSGRDRMVLHQFRTASDPKRPCVRSEVAVERHSAADDRVLLPARDPFRVVEL